VTFLHDSIANILVTIPNVAQLLSGLHEALTDFGATTKLSVSNKERTNGWYKFMELKQNTTSCFAQAYILMTGTHVASCMKQRYENNFSPAIFEESIKRSTMDTFKNCYDQAVAYRSMVNRTKENRAREEKELDECQARMNATEQGCGLQPRGNCLMQLL
jgi:hypothetical protein